VEAFQKAIQLKAPDFPLAYNNLGIALRDQNKLGEAEAAYRRAIQLKPDYPEAYNNLGIALCDQKKRAEAEAAYRKAIELKPDYPEAYNNLGLALRGLKKLEEAEAAFRKAIQLQPNDPQVYYNLGHALREQNKLEEVEAAYRRAIELKPDFPEAYNNLGLALRKQNKLEEAVAAYRMADQLLPKHSIIRYNLSLAERLLQLERKLDACLAGREQPANPKEAAELASCAAGRELFRSALRFYTDALKQDPKLTDNLQASHRYHAACSAALAAAGKGRDAESIAVTERASLRQQALECLRANLKAYSTLLDKDGKAWPVIQQKLAHWHEDADLASVRGAAAIDKLPEAEREAWRKLWADVAALLKRTREE